MQHVSVNLWIWFRFFDGSGFCPDVQVPKFRHRFQIFRIRESFCFGRSRKNWIGPKLSRRNFVGSLKTSVSVVCDVLWELFFLHFFWWTGVSLQTTSLSRFFGARTNFFSFISKWLIIQQIWICPCLDFLTTLRFCRGKNIQSGAASLSWGIASSLVWRVLILLEGFTVTRTAALLGFLSW